jgi:hypothetical protein
MQFGHDTGALEELCSGESEDRHDLATRLKELFLKKVGILQSRAAARHRSGGDYD